MLWKKGRQSDNVEDRRGSSIGGTSIKLSGGMLVVVMLRGVVLEFQADCFAGVWAHYADKYRNLLGPGDINESLRAASAIDISRMIMKLRSNSKLNVYCYFRVFHTLNLPMKLAPYH